MFQLCDDCMHCRLRWRSESSWRSTDSTVPTPLSLPDPPSARLMSVVHKYRHERFLLFYNINTWIDTSIDVNVYAYCIDCMVYISADRTRARRLARSRSRSCCRPLMSGCPSPSATSTSPSSCPLRTHSPSPDAAPSLPAKFVILLSIYIAGGVYDDYH